MFTSVLVLTASFLMAFLLIPSIMHLAVRKNLYSNTKPVLMGQKKRQISNLGGVAVFVSLRISHSIFIDIPDFPVNYYIASLFILFLVGLNDDLTGVRPISRLLAQCIVALIMVYPGELYFNSLDNLFSGSALPASLSQLLSIIFIIGLINAYNLIDGIDGLAGSLGAIGSFIFAYLFYQTGDTELAMLCLALFGSLLAFLFFNISPAKIFMGDSGAYIIGFTFAMLSIALVNKVQISPIQWSGITITSAYGLVAAIIMIPVFDTLRVFVLRLYKKAHPFKGDNNHIHHRLLNMGFNHTQTTFILSLTTLALFVLSISLQHLHPLLQLTTLFFTCLLLNLFTYLLYIKKGRLITQ